MQELIEAVQEPILTERIEEMGEGDVITITTAKGEIWMKYILCEEGQATFGVTLPDSEPMLYRQEVGG